MREVNILGVLIPGLIPLFCISVVLLWIFEKVFRFFKVYAKVAHPPFFRICVFTIIFCCCGILVYK